ncbi:GntR family transcriptional regulator [Streptomyces pseudogriseolus]|uniref:GntR family transcriptional regulator n=1 Tax=Streptomyces pseudogriseolus TaxID=36817 RepID=UPI00348B87BA
MGSCLSADSKRYVAGVAGRGGESGGGGRGAQRVADELRARTGHLYPLHSFLPAQRALAVELGVSRDTVQRALRELVNEPWAPTSGSSRSASAVASSRPSASPSVCSFRTRHFRCRTRG